MSAPATCPSCGRPTAPGQRFCGNCGAALPAAAVPPPSVPPPSAAGPPPYPPPPGYAPPAAGYPPPYPPPPGAAYAGPYAPPPRRADFSNLFSGTFQVWTQNFVPLFVVYFIVALVIGFLSFSAAYAIFGVPYAGGTVPGVSPTPSSADVAALLAYDAVVIVIGWIITSTVIGGITDFSIRRFRGERVPIMDSLSRGFRRFPSILGANLLVAIITSGVVLLWAAILALGALSAFATSNPVGALAVLCGALAALPLVFVFVIYVDLALSLYAPVVMIEGAHAVDSLGRSWNLTKGHKWSLLAAAIVVGIILVVIDGLVVLGIALSGNAVAGVVASAVATAITGSWFTILVAVAYDLIVHEPQPTVWPPATTPMYPPR